MTWAELEERIAAWASDEANVRGAVVLGSRARREMPADEFSDLDLVLAVTDAEPLLAEAGWAQEIAPVLMTFVEETAVGGERERRVLYAGVLDVDYSVSRPRASVS